MKLSVEFKPYRRDFKTPFQTSHGLWRIREGVILRISDEEGNSVYSEVCPLPSHGTEALDVALKLLVERIREGEFSSETINREFLGAPALRTGIEFGLLQLDGGLVSLPQSLCLVGVLPAGEKALDVLKELLEQGYTTFKWKMGVSAVNAEQEVCRKIFEMLPEGCVLRLDANGGLSLTETKQWLMFLENRPVEFLEQPMRVGQEFDMRELAKDYLVELALDESLGSFSDIKQLEAMWEGVFIVKPTILGDISAFLNWRKGSDRKLVYSSALETAIGVELGVRVAAGDEKNSFALGYGIGGLFGWDHFCHPLSREIFKAGDFKQEGFEKLWMDLG